MTWAILGVPHPRSAPTGWAWVRIAQRSTASQGTASRRAHDSGTRADGVGNAGAHGSKPPPSSDQDSAIVASAVADFVERTLRQLSIKEGGASDEDTASAGDASKQQPGGMRSLASMGPPQKCNYSCSSCGCCVACIHVLCAFQLSYYNKLCRTVLDENQSVEWLQVVTRWQWR